MILFGVDLRGKFPLFSAWSLGCLMGMGFGIFVGAGGLDSKPRPYFNDYALNMCSQYWDEVEPSTNWNRCIDEAIKKYNLEYP